MHTANCLNQPQPDAECICQTRESDGATLGSPVDRRSPDMEDDLRHTLVWQTIKNRVNQVIEDGFDVVMRNQLRDHMQTHWSKHCPRQDEIAALRQKLRVAEAEVARRGQAIKALLKKDEP